MVQGMTRHAYSKGLDHAIDVIMIIYYMLFISSGFSISIRRNGCGARSRSDFPCETTRAPRSFASSTPYYRLLRDTGETCGSLVLAAAGQVRQSAGLSAAAHVLEHKNQLLHG